MQFAAHLRDGVRRGEITCSVRIWQSPRVKVGGRYRLAPGEVEVDALIPMSFDDITPALARASGFQGVIDLLKTAKHGAGENVYLVRFHYVAPPATRAPRPKKAAAAARPRRAQRPQR